MLGFPIRFNPSLFPSVAVALTMLVPFHSAQSAAPKVTLLHSFTGTPDGQVPQANLVLGSNGVLYGTTTYGGVFGDGTVFELAPPAKTGDPWLETVLYSFQGINDGQNPTASVTLGKGGSLYGTTSAGGTGNSGTVFQLTPPSTPGNPWTETVLYSFTGGADGGIPQASLLFQNRVLYGTTLSGGTGNNGTVFQLQAPTAPGGAWTESVLYAFAGPPDGQNPYGGLVLGSKGEFYGTTHQGGTHRRGTVFQLTPPSTPGGTWTETILHDFRGHPDGREPRAGLAIDSKGVLYGTTAVGGKPGFGTVFSLTPPATVGGAWTKTQLFAFRHYLVDGAVPYAGVTLGAGGVLYGTTYSGGAKKFGVLFELKPTTKGPWKQIILHTFTGSPKDGATPAAGVIVGPNGELYGTTSYGGTFEGTVYEVVF